MVVCSAPSAPSLLLPTSFMPSFTIAGSSSFPAPPVASFSFVNFVASSSTPPSSPRGVSRLSPGLGSDVGPSLSPLSAVPHVSVGDCLGTSGTACSLSDVDPVFDKEPPLAKDEFSKSFQEMIALITTYFSASKPSDSSESDSLIPWLDVSVTFADVLAFFSTCLRKWLLSTRKWMPSS